MARPRIGDEASAARDEARIARASFGRYLVTWIALTALTFATFGLSHLHLGAFSVVVALAIAVAKSLLVVLFFMHMWDERGTIPLAFGVSFVFIAILIAFTMTDVHGRFPPSVPRDGASVKPTGSTLTTNRAKQNEPGGPQLRIRVP